MVDATHKSFDASDRSLHAVIKKEVQRQAAAHQFSDKRIAEVDIAVVEITSNLFKHARNGELLVGIFKEEGTVFIELIAIDQGPGMTDIKRMMTDGYSTKNTMGHGLGSIKRLADEFDVFSSKDWGTILLARFCRDRLLPEKRRCPVLVSPLVVCKPKELRSGDGHYVDHSERYTKIMLADGLGHGVEANIAMNEAVSAFRQCLLKSPVEIIRHIHPLVRKTRGLVATIAIIDRQRKSIHIAGIGNIAARLTGPLQSKSPLSYNGIIGHNIPTTMHDQVLDLEAYQQLVLCSDGIRTRWDSSRMSLLTRHDLSIQAAAIYKDFARRTDDMSVLVAKFKS